MSDINHENPMYCATSPPSDGPRKYAMLTLFESYAIHERSEIDEKNPVLRNGKK